MTQPLEPIDSRGNAVQLGANVEIPSLPVWLTRDLPIEEITRLRSVEGSVMRVLEIDKFGYLWFGMNSEGRWFCLRPEEVVAVGAS
jgi:hypothetical protein